jgi:hypothetical protein
MLLPLLWTCVLVRWKVNDVCVTSCMDSIEPCVGGCGGGCEETNQKIVHFPWGFCPPAISNGPASIKAQGSRVKPSID